MRLLLVFLTILSPLICTASNILFLAPFPFASHWLWLNHFVRDLLARGHHLTVLSNFPTKEPHPNLTEIIIQPKFELSSFVPRSTFFEMNFANAFENVQLVWNVGLITTEYAFNDPKVKALIVDKDLKFDLIISEQFYQESVLMFAHKFKCPIVTIGTLNYADHLDNAMGMLTPWSIVPHLMLTYSDRMSFKERAYNAYVSLYTNFMRNWYFMPKMQEMAERHFSKHIKGPLPQLRDLERNISLMLINSHRAIDPPRPKMPGLIDVGGAHIKPAKPLPAELQHFLDKSTNGVVYFSLGSYIQGTDLPTDKFLMILKVFSTLKENVLWKFENETVKNLPANVMIYKWMPQNDILAHPNVKVFITHGGIFGSQEGLYWGKPLLCLPLYADQHRNSLKAASAGYARTLNLAKMTEQDLLQNLQLLLKNPRYKQKAMEVSKKFRDNPIHPLDEAAYWIDYTIRYKGAKHLKSAGAFMPWYQYLLLDVVACCLIVIFLTLWLIWKLWQILNAILNRKTKKCDEPKKRL